MELVIIATDDVSVYIPFSAEVEALGYEAFWASNGLEAVMETIRAEHDIVRYLHHVVKTGRTRFIEVDIIVGPKFALQTIEEQDRLRERIWRSLGVPLEEAWLSICLTRDRRWV